MIQLKVDLDALHLDGWRSFFVFNRLTKIPFRDQCSWKLLQGLDNCWAQRRLLRLEKKRKSNTDGLNRPLVIIPTQYMFTFKTGTLPLFKENIFKLLYTIHRNETNSYFWDFWYANIQIINRNCLIFKMLYNFQETILGIYPFSYLW